MRLPLLLAAAALLAPAAAVAHDMRGEGPPPPLAGAPWTPEGPDGYGPRRGPPPLGAACPGAHAEFMGPPRFMGAPMRFAGPRPCGRCLTRRPVRLHDGWLSWPGKTYF